MTEATYTINGDTKNLKEIIEKTLEEINDDGKIKPGDPSYKCENSIEFKNIFFKKEIGLEHLSLCYNNENLNFLCGSGTSIYLGGKTINSSIDLFQNIIEKFKKDNVTNKILVTHFTEIETIINSKDLLEIKLDKINQYILYHEQFNVCGSDILFYLKSFFKSLLKEFVNICIPFPYDYTKDKLNIHELFINKIISRKESFNRPKLFTPNYDLAFENASERLGVSYNNGFRGVHIRKFDPNIFSYETFIKYDIPEKGTKIKDYLNIYKLHGSISWAVNENLNDIYKIVEVQICDDTKKEDIIDKVVENILIYPMQTKKSYSLDLPYSEMFRNMNHCLSETQNTLVIIGYSFLDEHINDIIKSGLHNPKIKLIIYSFSMIDKKKPKFLQMLKQCSLTDHRIIIYEGKLFGDFENIVKYLIPLNTAIPTKDILIDTLNSLAKTTSI